MHVCLLLSLLSSLYASDRQAHAIIVQEKAQSAITVSLRQERMNKVECAPPFSARVLYDAFLVDEPEPDDEENTDTRVAEYIRFPAFAQHHVAVASLPPLRLAQTQLERPPRG